MKTRKSRPTVKDSEIHLPNKQRKNYSRTRDLPLKKDILFVTAFKNIHRDQWKDATRNVETYLKYFMNLIKLPYTIIVYVEKDLKNLIPVLNNVIVRDLNEVNTFYNTFLERDKQIMKSKAYKSKIPESRKKQPEHLYSDYNLITHSKINFVSHTKDLYPNYEFYSWVDFGFSRKKSTIPCSINVSRLPKKIIIQTMNTPITISEEELLAKDDIYFPTGAFILHHSLIDVFEKAYKKKLIEWQKRGITDDDQSLILQLYLDNPSMFHTLHDKNWFMLYPLLSNI